jgi:hypothetical protein
VAQLEAQPNQTPQDRNRDTPTKASCQARSVSRFYKLPREPRRAPGQLVVFHPRVAPAMASRAALLGKSISFDPS